MSASGKSSNRHYEYSRGYSTGGGHGIYAAQGAADRQRRLEREAAARTTPPASTAPSAKAKTPTEPLPVSFWAAGFVALQVAAAGVSLARRFRS